MVAAEALAFVNLVSGERVGEIRSGKGHLDLAGDLVALSALFSDHWDQANGRTAVRREEIERAATLGPELLVALGAREQEKEIMPTEARDARVRAFTLFSSAYGECRRAVAYLRWHEGDAEEITPSLFASRSGSRKPGADAAETTVGAPAPTAPVTP